MKILNIIILATIFFHVSCNQKNEKNLNKKSLINNYELSPIQRNGWFVFEEDRIKIKFVIDTDQNNKLCLFLPDGYKLAGCRWLVVQEPPVVVEDPAPAN